MSSQHTDQDRPITVRPPRAVVAAAQSTLIGRGLKMRAFVTACLSALAADPDRFLATLADHWPPDKPHGRPRADADDEARDTSR